MALRVFDLTPFTRRAKEDRTIVVQGWEIKWTVWVTLLVSFAPCLLLSAATFPFLREYFVIVFIVLEALVFWAVLGRSRKGLQLRNWQHIRSRYKTLTGSWLIANEPFDPLEHEWRVIRQSTVPNPYRKVRVRAKDQTGISLFDPEPTPKKKKKKSKKAAPPEDMSW